MLQKNRIIERPVMHKDEEKIMEEKITMKVNT